MRRSSTSETPPSPSCGPNRFTALHRTARPPQAPLTSMIPRRWFVTAAAGSMARIARSTGPTQKLQKPQALKMAWRREQRGAIVGVSTGGGRRQR